MILDDKLPGDRLFDRCNAADVSWISKFPDECEILFGKSVPLNYDP